PGPERKLVIDALTVGLTAVPPPSNLDVKALKGAKPWLRLRVGNYRILYRPLTAKELVIVSATPEDLVAIGINPKKLAGLTAKQAAALTLSPRKLAALQRRRQQRAETGYVVARIVHRRDLERAVRTLPM
ncbi:MAG: hypothetical protein ACRDPR_21020, partial [Nocardioidaceae bacterium]